MPSVKLGQNLFLLATLFGTAALVRTGPATAQTATERIEALQRQMEEMQRAFEEQLRAMQAEIDAMREREKEVATRLPPPPAGDEKDLRYSSAVNQTLSTTKPVFSIAPGDTRVSLSGQVNRAINVADDGDTTKAYFVDNDVSNSRLRVLGVAGITEDIGVGGQIELAFSPNNSSEVSQDNEDTGNNFIDDRRVEVAFNSLRYGRVWLGKGSGAADDTAEFDLSGTDVIMYSGVADIVGGLQFTDSGDLTGVTVADAFFNLDGGRYDRVRYDTPVIGPGLQASVSSGEDQRHDLALNWGGDFGNWTGVEIGPFTTIGAIAIWDPSQSGVDYNLDGSFSALHNPTGLSLTLAAGMQEADGASNPYNLYGKLGWQTAFFDFGDTRFGVDVTQGRQIFELEDGAERTAEGWSVGAAAVQGVSDHGLEFFAQGRWFTVDQDGFNDIIVGTVGSRLKF